MYFDGSKLLSYNRVYNFVVGNRGGGKTYWAKKWAINDYLKNGKHFVYVRRYKSEMKRVKQFFADVKHEYPGVTLEVKGSKAYCNGKEFGTFLTLSTSMQEKSTSYPEVNKIIFDEFIIDKGVSRYLKNEVEIFHELFETVARMRDDVRAIFLANAVTIANPYFNEFGVASVKKEFTKLDHIVIQMYVNQEFIDKKKETRFGQMISKTNYGAYAINNEFLRDNDAFIEKKTGNADFMMCIKYCGKYYGFWVDYNKGYIYVNSQYDPYTKNFYAITNEDHEPNLLLLSSFKNNTYFRRIKFAFANALLRFDNMQTKYDMFDMMKIM